MSRTISTILSMRDNMSGGIMRVSRNVEGMTSQMRRASQQSATFANNAKKNFEKIGDKAVKLGISIAGIAAGIAAKTGLGEAMDMEGFRIQLETATKSAKKAGEIMKWSVDLANKTPFETGSIIEMSSKFEGMGLSAKKWGGITADMAGATNKDIIQATEAIIDAQTGELERLKEFGISKAMITTKANQMFKGVEVVNKKGQIVDQEKFNEAMMAIMQEKYKGGAAKLANTTKGMWSTVTGITKTSLANIVGIQNDGTIKVGSLLDTIKQKVKLVADQFTKWQNDGTIQRIGDKATEVFNKIFDVTAKVFNFLKNNINTIENVAIVFASFYVAIKIMTLLKGVILGVQIVMALLNGTLLLSPFGWAVLAIGLLIAAGVLLWKNWDTVKVKLDDFCFGLRNAFSNVGTFVGNVFKGMGNDFIDSINTMIGVINLLPGVKIGMIEKYEMGTYKSLTKPEGKNTKRGTTQYASGTNYSRAGLALVGEKGPEIVNLRKGSTVTTAEKTSKILGGNNGVNVYVTIQGNVIGNEQYADYVGNHIIGKVKLALGNM